MIKVKYGYVSKCLLCCLEQTESKYGEALAHSDGLTKNTVLVMWKVLEIKKICLFFFCQKFRIKLFTDSLIENATVGSWVYSQSNFCDAVTCLVVTVLELPPLPPKSKNVRIRVFPQSSMILWLQNVINIMFSEFKIE